MKTTIRQFALLVTQAMLLCSAGCSSETPGSAHRRLEESAVEQEHYRLEESAAKQEHSRLEGTTAKQEHSKLEETTAKQEHKGLEETAVNKDPGQLSQLLTLSRAPSAVWWEKISPVPGVRTNDWALVAVLEYSDQELKELLTTLEPHTTQEPLFYASARRGWFPKEVLAHLRAGPEGSFFVEGEVFQPTSFAKSPLLNGYVISVPGTRYLFLYLFTT